jgi:NAD(P)-dependent dehydrogenase (short-subunit alcohol dehydrogenase family)
MSECHSVGCFLCVRAVLNVMLQQEPMPMVVAGRSTTSSPRHMSRGSIVIITSLSAEMVVLGIGSYASAKHAVKGLVETAGKRLYYLTAR